MRASRRLLVRHLAKESLATDRPAGDTNFLAHIYIMNQILISEIVPRGIPIHHATRCVPLAERRKAATTRVEVKFKLPSQGDATEGSYVAEVICVRSTILGRRLD